MFVFSVEDKSETEFCYEIYHFKKNVRYFQEKSVVKFSRGSIHVQLLYKTVFGLCPIFRKL